MNTKNNAFANTMNREAEARKAAEEREAAKLAEQNRVNAILEDEKKYEDKPQYDLLDTLNDMKSPKGMKLVAINVVDRENPVVVGAAVGKEDADAMIECLHRYGKNLTTYSAVMNAYHNMMHTMAKANELQEAGLTPDRMLTVDGITYMVVNNVARDTTDGHKVADLDDYKGESLSTKIADELLTNRIRQHR